MVQTKEDIKAYMKVYEQTENGKMVNKINRWKTNGLVCDTYWEYVIIYYHWLCSTNCEKCNIKFTKGNTLYRKCMDHEHLNGKYGQYRNILCNRCNANDRVDNTSGTPNISWCKTFKRWIYRKKKHSKRFTLKEDAIKYKIEYEK